MNYVGVDIHKKYSVLCALDENGRKVGEARVEGNAPSGFARFFASLDSPSKAVVEACWNWGLIHEARNPNQFRMAKSENAPAEKRWTAATPAESLPEHGNES